MVFLQNRLAMEMYQFPLATLLRHNPVMASMLAIRQREQSKLLPRILLQVQEQISTEYSLRMVVKERRFQLMFARLLAQQVLFDWKMLEQEIRHLPLAGQSQALAVMQ